MSDDWRVHAILTEPEHAGPMMRALHEHEVDVERDLHKRLGDKLPVSNDGNNIFVYASTGDQAEAAATALKEAAEGQSIEAKIEVTRWHPEAEEWRAPTEPLPESAEQIEAEHQAREKREAEESAQQGLQWQVRIDLEHRSEAITLERQLTDQGLRSLRRFKHLFLYCATEDDARDLAAQLESTTPAGAVITPEGTPWAGDWQTSHPFAILGGLGDS